MLEETDSWLAVRPAPVAILIIASSAESPVLVVDESELVVEPSESLELEEFEELFEPFAFEVPFVLVWDEESSEAKLAAVMLLRPVRPM